VGESLVAREFEMRELALREREIALREREILAQERRWEAEMELKRAEYDRLQKLDAENVKQEDSQIARTKKIAESVKHVFVKTSDDPAELPLFFAGVENFCVSYTKFLETCRLSCCCRCLLRKLVW